MACRMNKSMHLYALASKFVSININGVRVKSRNVWNIVENVSGRKGTGFVEVALL